MAEITIQPARVENLTLWQRVYAHLRAEILEGRLEPGAELAEVALSEQLGVSRGPIREAIGRLASEGLVTVRPRRGAVVRSLSKEEFLELYQVREALERMAMQLAVPRLAAEHFEELTELNTAMDAHAAARRRRQVLRGEPRLSRAAVRRVGQRQAPGAPTSICSASSGGTGCAR